MTTERGEERRMHLAIDEREAARFQFLYKGHQCDFRRIGGAGEHRFAEEHTPKRDAVQSADQRALAPSLERMRVASAVQRKIGRAHRPAEPGAFLAVGAAGEHALECRVDADLVALVAYAL